MKTKRIVSLLPGLVMVLALLPTTAEVAYSFIRNESRYVAPPPTRST